MINSYHPLPPADSGREKSRNSGGDAEVSWGKGIIFYLEFAALSVLNVLTFVSF